jgi:hypothetical protein
MAGHERELGEDAMDIDGVLTAGVFAFRHGRCSW